MRQPEVAGDRPLAVRLTYAYVERLLRVAEQDVVAEAFNHVSDLVAPPQHNMRPRVLWRVLLGSVGRPRTDPSDPATDSRPNVQPKAMSSSRLSGPLDGRGD